MFILIKGHQPGGIRASKGTFSSCFSYWQGTIQASYAVMRQLLLYKFCFQDFKGQNKSVIVSFWTYLSASLFTFEPRCEKTCLRGFRSGPRKPGCTATEDG